LIDGLYGSGTVAGSEVGGALQVFFFPSPSLSKAKAAVIESCLELLLD
jgi:hypothetical protein